MNAIERQQHFKISTAVSNEAIAVQQALIERGLETPMINNHLTREQKYQKIKAAMKEVVETLGMDLNDDSLQETPHRIAKMYVDEIFSGLDYAEFPKISMIENKMGVEEMVKIKDIGVVSTCEHHFVTIDGMAKVAYIPKDKV
ncbi:MAG: GTP cyclohydrolase I, partial [Litorivivens sp.]